MKGYKDNRKCFITECFSPARTLSLCNKHTKQIKNYGHLLSEQELHEMRSQACATRPPVSDTTKEKHRKNASANYKNVAKVLKNTGRTHFKKGTKPWNTGKKDVWSDEHIAAIKLANTGRVAWNRGKQGLMPTPHNKIGEGITSQSRMERVKFSKNVQQLVFQRDDYTCQICEQHGGYLQVDHIKRWADYPELRFELDNCRTVCMACHYYITFKRKLPEGVIWGHNLSRRIQP